MTSNSVSQRILKTLAVILFTITCAACKVIVIPLEGGSVSSVSGSRDCASVSCDFEANGGFSETFTAVPDAGYEFSGWVGWGACEDTGNVCEVVIPALWDELIALNLDVTLTASFKLSSPQDLGYLGEVELLDAITVTARSISLNLLADSDSTFSYTLPSACASSENNSFSRSLSDSGQSDKIAVQVVLTCSDSLQADESYALTVREELSSGYRQSTLSFTPVINSDSASRLLTINDTQMWSEAQLRTFFSRYVDDSIAAELSIPLLLQSLVSDLIGEMAENAWSQLMNPQVDYPVITESVTYSSVDPLGERSELLSGLVAYPDTSAIGDFSAKNKVIILHHATGTTPSAQGSDNAWFLIASIIAAKGYLVVAPDNYGRGSTSESEETYLQAQFTASNAIDMLLAVQAWQGYQHVLPTAATRLKLAIAGYSQGGHSAVSTMMQLLLGHQDSFDVTEVYAGAGPYALYDSSKGALEKIAGECSDLRYCDDVDAEVSLPYLLDRIGPAYLSYRDTGLETTDLIFDGELNTAFGPGFLANESQYDAFKTFLQIDSFDNISNIDQLENTVKLMLYHSEADRLVPVQNSVDFVEAISSGIDTELDPDVCNSSDLLQIANIVNIAGAVHSLCGFNAIEEILSKL